ncbi:MAG: YbaB/EbfC family nucleoid-associated protein [Oscillospiraceae bacterium]
MKARLPQGMGGGAQNMNSMIKQAQKMQTEITAIQEDIELREFSTSVGGGAVDVTLLGNKSVKALTIKPDVVDKDDIEMLQDLIISAVNECIKKIDDTSEAEISKITGGVSLPGLF